MVDLDTYELKILNTGDITPDGLFINAYKEYINESEQVRSSAKKLRVILDAKYEKEDLYKETKNQFHNLTETQRKELLKLLQKTRICSTKDLVPGKISSRLQTKRGYEADMFKTISSTKYTKRNIKRGI